MKITFPYLGPVLAYQKLFESLGHEVIVPPRPSQRTIELGIKYSPEYICFPFKIILGSYLEAIERGAELVVTSGGIGACRAVYYGDLSEKILHKLGYDVQFLVFDNLIREFPEFYRQAEVIRNRKPLLRFLEAVYLALHLVAALDKYERLINRLRPREKQRGSCTKKWREIQSLLAQCDSRRDLQARQELADRIIASIAVVPRDDIIRVGLVGEIYLVMEGSMNNELEDKLAALGVEVIRYKYISHWLKHCFFPSHQLLKKTDRYLKNGIGGHEKENIGYMIKYKELGYDGIIHLMPFGCMPELVTQTIIPALARDLDFPILSLSLDEQMGWVNHQIRLEAFIDLLRSRKEQLKRDYNYSG